MDFLATRVDPAAFEEEHPLVEEGLDIAQDEFSPYITGMLADMMARSCKRYLCTVALTGFLAKPLGRRPSLLSVLLGPGLFFGAGLLTEFGARCIASTLLQWRAAAVQKRALLTDVKSDFALAVPHELEREERIPDARVWVTKASFGVTPIWFRRMHRRGWAWSPDLRHWQSVQSHRSIGGTFAGLLPVRSNRWLLRRLHMRDVRDRVRRPRVPHAPPPLALPEGLDEDPHLEVPADFLCPIAHTVMTDPVVGPAGVSYERTALLQWLRTRRTDPSTQGALEIHEVYANLTLRSMIAAWAQRQAHGDRQEDAGTIGGTSGTTHMESSTLGGGCFTQGVAQPQKKPRRRGLRSREQGGRGATTSTRSEDSVTVHESHPSASRFFRDRGVIYDEHDND